MCDCFRECFLIFQKRCFFENDIHEKLKNNIYDRIIIHQYIFWQCYITLMTKSIWKKMQKQICTANYIQLTPTLILFCTFTLGPYILFALLLLLFYFCTIIIIILTNESTFYCRLFIVFQLFCFLMCLLCYSWDLFMDDSALQ